MKFEETHVLYNKIKKDTQLTDDALALLGVTKEKIDKSIKTCTDAGMSRKKSMEVVYKMWENAGK